MFEGKQQIESVLTALAEQLEVRGVMHCEMVVCGGAALNILGYVSRVTEDVDVVAFVDTKSDGSTTLVKATKPMNPAIEDAATRVQKDFDLTDNWLNPGPASVMDLGLPDGLMDRVETRTYGKNLTIHFLSRYDQIHFKLYAVVDRDRGDVHYGDLLALEPTAEELEKAARWSMTHDISEGYRKVLKNFLKEIGYKDVADKL